MEKIILKGQSELSKKLGVSINNLQFIGMQSLTPAKYAFMPMFNIVDKKSELYMSTRAAQIFFKRDKSTNTYTPLNDWSEALKY